MPIHEVSWTSGSDESAPINIGPEDPTAHWIPTAGGVVSGDMTVKAGWTIDDTFRAVTFQTAAIVLADDDAQPAGLCPWSWITLTASGGNASADGTTYLYTRDFGR